MLFSKCNKNGNFYSKIPWKWLWEALKTKKSPPPHVWCHQNRSTYRMIIPFDSVDTPRTKQVFKSHQMHLQEQSNFCRALQGKPWRFLERIFWYQTCDFWRKSFKNMEIDYRWTFAYTKTFWDVVWSRQTLRWIAYDLRNALQTYLVVEKCVKRAERQFCVKLDFQNASKMAIFTPKFFENGFERLWKRKNRHLLTFGGIKIDPRIIWSPCLLLRIPLVSKRFPKAIRRIWRRAISFSCTLSQSKTCSW